MRPQFSIYNSANMALLYSKLSSELSLENSLFPISIPYGLNYGIRQSVISRLLSASFIIPSLLSHVVIIVGVCAREKVCRIATCPIIAMVAYIHSIWNWASGKTERKSVGTPGSTLKFKAPISILPFISIPWPASIESTAFINIVPEVLICIFWSHRRSFKHMSEQLVNH
jgi:hypothetical protein